MLHLSNGDYFVTVHCKYLPFLACSMVGHILVLSKLSCRFRVGPVYFIGNLLSFDTRLPFGLSVWLVLGLEVYLLLTGNAAEVDIDAKECHCWHCWQIALVFHLRKLDWVLRIIQCCLSLWQTLFCLIFELCFCWLRYLICSILWVRYSSHLDL